MISQQGASPHDDDDFEVIRLDLTRAVDMFETPSTDLGDSHGSFQPGIDRCIAELQSRAVRRPVHVELTLPSSEIGTGLEDRFAATLGRYCDERSHMNDCKRRSTQRSGVRALRIGVPVTMLGLLITAVAVHTGQSDDPARAVVDIVGWVLAWLGLWYPFDKLLFYPLDYVRENRALDALRHARITVLPRPIDRTAESPA